MPITPIRDISYGNHPYQQMDVCFPQGHNADTPVVFIIHGGGFIAGQKENFTTQAALFFDEGFITVNLSHRLIDATGMFGYGPRSSAGAITIPTQIDDVEAVVQAYQARATGWGSATARMYMAGHSAGAILTLLYLQGAGNEDGHIRAGGNWAGATDLSLLGNAGLSAMLPPARRAQIEAVYYRALGLLPGTGTDGKAISPYWVMEARAGGWPVISIYPEYNVVLGAPGEAATGLANTQRYHALLKGRGIAEQLSVYTGADHSFRTPPGSWQRLVKETAAFFKAH